MGRFSRIDENDSLHGGEALEGGHLRRQLLEDTPWAELSGGAPEVIAALICGGRSALSRGDHASCEVAFLEALRLAPSWTAPHICMAELCLRENADARALEFLCDAVALDSRDARIVRVFQQTQRVVEMAAAPLSDSAPTPLQIELGDDRWSMMEAITRVHDLSALAAASASSELPQLQSREEVTRAARRRARRAPISPRRGFVAKLATCVVVMLGLTAAVTCLIARKVVERRRSANELLAASRLRLLSGEVDGRFSLELERARDLGASESAVSSLRSRADLLARLSGGTSLAALSRDLPHALPSARAESDDAVDSFLRAEVARRAGAPEALFQLARVAEREPQFVAPRIGLLLLRAVASPRRASNLSARLSAEHPRDAALFALTELLRVDGHASESAPGTTIRRSSPTELFLGNLCDSARASDREQRRAGLVSALQLHPEDPELVGIAVLTASSVGDFQMAIQAAQQLATLPARPSYLALLARRLTENGDGVSALAILATHCRDSPGAWLTATRAALIATDEGALARCGLLPPEPRASEPVAPAACTLDEWLEPSRARPRSEPLEQLVDELLERAATEASPGQLVDIEQRVRTRNAQVILPNTARGRRETIAAWRAEAHAQPGRLDLRLKLAELLLDMGHFSEAEPQLSAAQELARVAGSLAGNRRARVGRAYAAIALSHYDDARQELDELERSSLDTPDQEISELRARLALGGNPRLALTLSKKGERTAAMISVQAEAELTLGMSSASVRSFSWLIQHEKEFRRARARVGLGEALLLRGEPLNAHYALEQAIHDLDEDDAGDDNGELGRALTLDGRALLHTVPPLPILALQRLQRAAAVHAPPEAQFWLGVAANLTGAARERQRLAWREYLKLEPTGRFAVRAKRLLQMTAP